MMTRAYTIRFTNQLTDRMTDQVDDRLIIYGPLDGLKEQISEQVHEMAASVYMAIKQLFVDLMYFIFVDVAGQLSHVLVLLSLLAVALGATKFASKSFKWGLITFIISLLASFGWGG